MWELLIWGVPMDVCAELHRAVQGRSAALQSGDLEEYLVSLSLRNMTLFHERHCTITILNWHISSKITYHEDNSPFFPTVGGVCIWPDQITRRGARSSPRCSPATCTGKCTLHAMMQYLYFYVLQPHTWLWGHCTVLHCTATVVQWSRDSRVPHRKPQAF